jgi:hypothetical protein
MFLIVIKVEQLILLISKIQIVLIQIEIISVDQQALWVRVMVAQQMLSVTEEQQALLG